MVAIAVFTVSFNVGSRYDFFASMNNVFDITNRFTTVASRVIQSAIGETVFAYDDDIKVLRMYFDHDLTGWRGSVDASGNRVETYIDIGNLNTPFAKAKFLASNDLRIVSMKMGFDVGDLGLKWKFYDSNDTLLYEWSMWRGFYYINVTYKDYLYNYRDEFSTDNWKYRIDY